MWADAVQHENQLLPYPGLERPGVQVLLGCGLDVSGVSIVAVNVAGLECGVGVDSGASVIEIRVCWRPAGVQVLLGRCLDVRVCVCVRACGRWWWMTPGYQFEAV